MRITLDNGETITCTPDHKFPVWNKGFVKAEDLTVGESMMPHYTRQKPIAKGAKKNYEQIFENETGEWQYTHRVVSNWKDDVGIENEFVFNEEYARQGLYTVHHVNINRHDNSPQNLVRMNSKDHIAWHRDSGSNSGKIGGRNSYLMGAGVHNK
jgi:DNA gyrase subunit B